MAASLAMLAVPAHAAVGGLSTFAGGVGWGRATNVAQSPVGVGMLGDRVLEVDGATTATELPGIGGHYPTVIRAIDVRTGLESVIAGHVEGGYSPDGSRAVGSPLSGALSAVGDDAGNVYFADNNRVRKITAAGAITTIAGTGATGFSGDGGPATMAELNWPQGVTLAPDGSIVFSDAANNRIRRISAGGLITTIAGNGMPGSEGDGGPALLAQLNSPFQLGFDPDGNLYVPDLSGGRIRVISPAGVITTFARTELGAMAVAGNGRVIVTYGSAVLSIDATGAATVIAGTEDVEGYSGDGGPATKALLDYPRGLTVDRSGNVFIADSANKRVRRIDASGVISTIAGNGSVGIGGEGGQAAAAQMQYIEIVRTGPTGTYISEGGERVRYVDTHGVMTTIRKSRPASMAVDRAGNLYMTEGALVLKRTPDGTVTVVAGSGDTLTSSGDGGPATQAGLAPRLLAVDGAGNLYISEERAGGPRIRRVDPSGIITTVAGADPLIDVYGFPVAALHAPIGRIVSMATGPDGSLYLLGTSYISRISCGVLTRVQTDISWDGLRYGAKDIAVDRAGQLFVATGSRVYRIAADGRVTAVAGGGPTPDSDGLPATSANFESATESISLNDAGDLHLADRGRVLNVTGVSAGASTTRSTCGAPAPPEAAAASYQPLAPARLLDTRLGAGGPVGPNATISVGVAGAGGVPATGATAVVLNLTVTQPTAGGYLSVFPSGAPRPPSSSVNFLPGQTVANLVVAKVGADGKVSIYNVAGSSHVVVDVVGWYGAEGSRFNGVVPARVLDTRAGAAVGPNATIALGVAGAGGVPATGATAVVLNLTVTQPTADGYLSVFPSGAPRPATSSVNFLPGQTVANLVVAKVGADGKVSIYNVAGSSHVVVDVVGWYGAEGSRFNTLVPARLLDTRLGASGPVGPNATIALGVAGAGGVPATGATAVVLNLTVTQPTAGGYLSVFPSGAPRPPTSSLNFLPGQTVANLVVAEVSADGKVSIYNVAGSSHVVVDVVGWFGAAG